MWKLLDGVISWGFVNAVWTGEDGKACRVEGSGACWAFIRAKFSQFIYGRYPEEERWRVDLVFAMALAGLVPLMVPQIPGKAWSAGFTFFIFPVIAFWLLTGRDRRDAGIVDASGWRWASSASSLRPVVLGRDAPRTLRLVGGSAWSSPFRWSRAGCSRPAASSSCRRCRPSCGAGCW